ncbi:MAG: hypothetical protein HOV79_32830 [Hamadaea sp.]|nr:hypothetical protein [Hamadaea sp.]
MSTVFGEVAGLYDEVRPEHPPELATAVLAYAGGLPDRAVEIGAGTGKATKLFAGRGFPIACLEPDARMAALLAGRFPQVEVVPTTFEAWTPPVDGVPLMYAALVWHWLTPVVRARLAARALAPGGVLAIIGRRSGPADAALDAEIQAVFDRHGGYPQRAPMTEWALPELAEEPFIDIRAELTEQMFSLTTERYLELQQTFSPFRQRPPEVQRVELASLREIVDLRGGTIEMRLQTTLILARRT